MAQQGIPFIFYLIGLGLFGLLALGMTISPNPEIGNNSDLFSNTSVSSPKNTTVSPTKTSIGLNLGSSKGNTTTHQ
jgi:hypothetical protein